MNYYEKVRDAVERIAECTTSDAQGIIEAWERRKGDTTGTQVVGIAEDQGTDPEDLARTILGIPDGPTPGPWSIDADKARNNLVVSSDVTGDVICEVVAEPGSDPVAEANARLIAAAAELREACIEALSLFDNYPACWEAIGTYEVLNNAITKATNP